ncbi:putative PAS/PAC sensor protein [Magnetococcus marinus MC-1]|uniref:histidine kinase n=1 Tax=Magnetococcus marinus (strain ATCC BAA-1437 / JCM 17883 / MC-1) TaxID=156889 RepID=A0LD36_MAGMM|nr:putative PAS/PAC sensor protein [Magnetococcus marinus MC-1]
MISGSLNGYVSTGLTKVFREGESVTFTNIRFNGQGGRANRLLNIHIKPVIGRKNQSPLAALFIQEQAAETRLNPADDAYDFNQETMQRIADLEQELQLTRENLQATIEELETSNEELQATNEELLASNEELQSTNEELQSVNEELYTVNAEYQNKIIELTEVNNDLDNLMNSTQVVSVFLDEDLDVRKFTTSSAKLFNILESDIGRPLAHLSHNLQEVDLITLALRVNKSHKVEEKVVRTSSGDWYQLRILPYRIATDAYLGVVLVFVNINSLHTAQQELLRVSESYGLVRSSAQIGSWDWNITTGELVWSDNIEEMFGVEKDQFDGSYDTFLKSLHPEDHGFVMESVKNAIEKDMPYDIDHRIICPDGTIRWMAETGTVIRNSRGKAERMIGVVRDITMSKDLEAQIQEKGALLQSIFKTAPIGIGLVNKRVFKWVNQQVCDITGYVMDELVGQDSRLLYPSDEEYTFVGTEKYRQIQVSGTGTVKTRWRRKDGVVIDVLMSSTPIDRHNWDKGVTFTVLDLTHVLDTPQSMPSLRTLINHDTE